MDSFEKGDRVTVVMTRGGLIPGSNALAGMSPDSVDAEFVAGPAGPGDVYHLKEFWGKKPYVLNGNSSFFVAMWAWPRESDD